MPRFLKYYVAIAAIVSLLSVSMGIYMNFSGSNKRIYCDFEVEEDRANFATADGPCRLRTGLILAVFGRIYLVLMFVLCAPIGLFVFIRRSHKEQENSGPLRAKRKHYLASWSGRPSGRRSEPSNRFRGLARWVQRHAGPFFIGYFVVSAMAVFLLGSYIAWAKLDHNKGMDYCTARALSGTFDFYSGGEVCQIRFHLIFFEVGIITIIVTLLLNAPAIIFYLCRFLMMWKDYFRSSEGR
ncbi:MAG: hypothetical protein O7A03_11025 [Alphaproteobacteria bacterium]|nr:hypothetical protein [Alphaproteobacteria bacterium]